MRLKDRIELLERLGSLMSRPDERLLAHVRRTAHHNPWFTEENQLKAMRAIADRMLQAHLLRDWADRYSLSEDKRAAPRKIGLIFAGNIPLVGFHDWLAVFVAGHRALVKLSERDPWLFPHLIKRMEEWEPASASFTQFVDRLKSFDAVIATGTNNSARYFEYYFGKYPHIIRRNRNSIAVLSGEETTEELRALGEDIFSYFGLGCRNVSKLYLPKGKEEDIEVLSPLLEVLHEHYKEVILHTPYKNNFDYTYALLMLNKEPFFSTGSLIFRKDPRLSSRIATVHYGFYEDEQYLTSALEEQKREIQCIVAAKPIEGFDVLPFGKSQQPGLTDYPDGVDVMRFLCDLNPSRVPENKKT